MDAIEQKLKDCLESIVRKNLRSYVMGLTIDELYAATKGEACSHDLDTVIANDHWAYTRMILNYIVEKKFPAFYDKFIQRSAEIYVEFLKQETPSGE